MRSAIAVILGLSIAVSLAQKAFAEQPPAPRHPNPSATTDQNIVENRGDVVNLPRPLKDTLGRLANRPHSVFPLQVFAEADNSSQLFQYYLLHTNGFSPR